MKTFFLDVNTPTKGIYLSSEMIDLLSIIQCENIEELRDFEENCSQINSESNEKIVQSDSEDLEKAKRRIFEKYKSTIVPLKQSVQDRISVLKSSLEHCKIPKEEIDSYITTFQTEGISGVQKKLQLEHPDEYEKFSEKEHRFIASERDQIKSLSYKEMCEINKNLINHNTILICSGRFYNVKKKMYNEQIPNMQKYDFYHAKRELDFCYKNGKYARYHTLLDKQTMEGHFAGEKKEDVLRELKEYVKASIDFISKYNEEHKINGKGVITSVDLFNEIISFDKPYKNNWQEIYGISTEELAQAFEYAQENKPEGVTYVYNEPFLEDPERRKAVIEQFEEINKHAPGLIDTIGTQMHIEMTQSMDNIRECFEDLKELESQGISTQITEFDMCLPERFMFDENGKLSSKYSPDFIYNFKSEKIREITDIITETGIHLDGITYWSVSDTLDHNLQRTNTKTYSNNLQREIAISRYSGLYGDIEREFTIEDFSKVIENAKETDSLDSMKKIKEAVKANEIKGKEDNDIDERS